MKYKFSDFDKRENADVLILPFWEGSIKSPAIGAFKTALDPVLDSGDFKGKQGEIFFVYPAKNKETKILLLGLGKEDKATIELLRRSYSSALRAIRNVKAKSANLFFPKSKHLSHRNVILGVWEGLLLTNYSFNDLLGDGLKDVPPLLEKVGFIEVDTKDKKDLEEILVIMEGVHFARDLVNGNADEVTPSLLAKQARGLEKVSSKISTSVYDRKWLEKEKMGLILAVNRASQVDPFLLEVSYKGNAKSKDHIVLVGKGVTYDTGGLSLKPTEGMLGMKCDMAGAAAVLATLRTIAMLDLSQCDSDCSDC